MSKEYVIMADSTCDLSKDLREEYGITVLAGHVNAPDGREYDVMPDWDENFTQESFYSALKKNPAGFQTAPPSVYESAQAMEEAVKAGKDIMLQFCPERRKYRAGKISGRENRHGGFASFRTGLRPDVLLCRRAAAGRKEPRGSR